MVFLLGQLEWINMNKINTINKKGILLSEGIRIILAVIAILLLIYLAVQLSSIFTRKSEQEQAKESMNGLIDEIRAVENGQKSESQLFIESPNDWWIIAWPYKEDRRKPKQCKGDYCVCICPIPDYTKADVPSLDNSLDFCSSIGVCEDVSKKTKTIYESKPEGTFVNIVKGFISLFKDVKNIPLDISHPLPIKIKFVENEIHIIK